MSKNVIFIMDSIKSFSKGFKAYVEQHTEDKVYIITSIDELSEKPYDFLLIDSAYISEVPYIDNRVFQIVGQNILEDGVSNNINRYQKPNLIYNKLLNRRLSKQETTKLMTTFSMAGGSGKTIFCQSLCSGLVDYGKSVLYLSFAPYVVGEKDIDLSLLIYYLYHEQPIPTDLVTTIREKVKQKSSYLSCSLSTPEDNLYVTPEVVTKLFKWLCTQQFTEYLIVEIPWVFDYLLKASLRHEGFKLLIGDQRHSEDEIANWAMVCQQAINDDKDFYCFKNRSEENRVINDIYEIPVFQEHHVQKGMKEWINKYLLTHWMKI